MKYQTGTLFNTVPYVVFGTLKLRLNYEAEPATPLFLFIYNSVIFATKSQ